ncbi:MAG: S53 family peptidase [Lapillicoccus sp.]
MARIRLSRLATGIVTLAASLAVVAGSALPVSASPHPGSPGSPATATGAPAPGARHQSCGQAAPGTFRCFSTWQGTGNSTTPPSQQAAGTTASLPTAGYRPADIAAAYELKPVVGTGPEMTVAIVDAYDNPHAESDLRTYRAAFGLSACTTANGCFRKVDQRGGSHLPPGDPGWGVEIALDVQAVSASCPTCKILLVEADDSSLVSIGKAVATAARLGAKVISNSYGADEFTGVVAFGQTYYRHPGVAQVVSSGDYGFAAASFPATLPQAVAVGGTTLRKTTSGTWSEKAWSGAGSGCSAWFAKSAWQKDTHCSMRTTSDLSAVADPATGFAVYDTYGLGSDNGWIVVGGTSLAAPLIAGMIARAGHPGALDTAQYAYTHRSGLKDVVGGRNGFCGGDYLCTAKKGYDGPTGLGSPRGLSAL